MAQGEVVLGPHLSWHRARCTWDAHSLPEAGGDTGQHSMGPLSQDDLADAPAWARRGQAPSKGEFHPAEDADFQESTELAKLC